MQKYSALFRNTLTTFYTKHSLVANYFANGQTLFENICIVLILNFVATSIHSTNCFSYGVMLMVMSVL